jgi:hypothetical protein
MGYAEDMRVRAWIIGGLLLVGCGNTTLLIFEETDGGSDAMVHPRDGGQDVVGDVSADTNEAGVATLATKQVLPLAIALSPSEVYWTNAGVAIDGGVEANTGSIWEFARKGGVPAVLVSHLTDPEVLAYGASGGSGGVLAWSAQNGPTGSVTTQTLATHMEHTFEGLSSPLGVAIDGDRVYGVESLDGAGIVIKSAPLTGGGSLVVGSIEDGNQPGYMAITPAGATGNRYIFVTADTPGGGGVVYAVPIGGGTMSPIWATTAGEPYGIVADESNVYWTVPSDVTDGTLYQLPLISIVEGDAGGGSPPTVLASSLSNSFFLAVDSKHVYFTSNVAKGGVFSVPIGGGAVHTLAADLSFPGGIAADDSDDFVYFTTFTTVARVHK